jgi:hypothetical protein
MVATQYVPLQTFLTAVGELRDTRESLAIVREAARRARTMLKPGSTVGVGAVRDSLGEALLASEKTKAAA